MTLRPALSLNLNTSPTLPSASPDTHTRATPDPDPSPDLEEEVGLETRLDGVAARGVFGVDLALALVGEDLGTAVGGGEKGL